MNTAKLTNAQRKILQDVVATFELCGTNVKPVSLAPTSWRVKLSEFNASYATYNRQMFKLLDAGILARMARDDNREDSHAYVRSIAAVRAVLAAGEYEVIEPVEMFITEAQRTAEDLNTYNDYCIRIGSAVRVTF